MARQCESKSGVLGEHLLTAVKRWAARRGWESPAPRAQNKGKKERLHMHGGGG